MEDNKEISTMDLSSTNPEKYKKLSTEINMMELDYIIDKDLLKYMSVKEQEMNLIFGLEENFVMKILF